MYESLHDIVISAEFKYYLGLSDSTNNGIISVSVETPNHFIYCKNWNTFFLILFGFPIIGIG